MPAMCPGGSRHWAWNWQYTLGKNRNMYLIVL